MKLILLGVAAVVLVGAVLGVVLTRPDSTVETGDFSLTVSTPQNETVVSTFQTTVEGVASPDAVVSVNGALADVALDGSFSTLVSLEEGPNLIEVVASDYEGNEASEILTVIYVA